MKRNIMKRNIIIIVLLIIVGLYTFDVFPTNQIVETEPITIQRVVETVKIIEPVKIIDPVKIIEPVKAVVPEPVKPVKPLTKLINSHTTYSLFKVEGGVFRINHETGEVHYFNQGLLIPVQVISLEEIQARMRTMQLAPLTKTEQLLKRYE